MTEKRDSIRHRTEEADERIPLTRRGILAASGAIGLALSSSSGIAAATHEGDDSNPFAEEGHDHHGDYLGESQPVSQIDVGKIVADNVSTVRYADSIAELNEYIEQAPDNGEMANWSGVKIVLRQGELSPTAEDLPVQLKSGVVIEGQGPKATTIDVGGIGKPVFKLNRSQEKIRRHVALRDLKVLGSWIGEGDPTPGSKGVLLKNVHYWHIENCQFIGLDIGLDLPGSWTGTVSQCHIDGCSRYSIRAESFDNSPKGGMAPNNIRFTNSEVKRTKRGDPGVGIYVRDAMNVYISGVDVSGSSRYAVLAEDVGALAIHGSYFEHNGANLDRDGDGNAEPAAIGLAPGGSSKTVRGASIVGNNIGHAPGYSVGIDLNNVEGVHVTGNHLTGRRNKSLVELGPNMANVEISANYIRESADHRVVSGPLDGENIPSRELNDGVWRTSELGTYATLETLARTHLPNANDHAIDIVLTADVTAESRTIDGSNFPPGTLFRGVGDNGVTVTSTGADAGDFALALDERQRAENVIVRATGGGIPVAVQGDEISVHDLSIPESNNVAMRIYGDRCSVQNIVCGPDVSAAIDIGVGGDAARIVGCEASINPKESTVMAANIDSQ